MKTLNLVALLSATSFIAAAQTATTVRYQMRIVPAQYSTVLDTIEIAPALNAAMDVQDYFLMPEVLEVKPQQERWTIQSGANGVEASLVKETIAAEHITIEKRFYPNRAILDIQRAEQVVPAETVVIARMVEMTPARIDYFISEEPTQRVSSEVLTSEVEVKTASAQ